MKRKLALLVLGCTLLVLAAVVMTGYLRVGPGPAVLETKSAPSISRELLLGGGKASASRILMSRNVSVSKGKTNTNKRGGLRGSTAPPQLAGLLQRATSRLYCSSRTRSSYNSIAKLVAGIGCEQCTGYILVPSFREQQTKASDNLFALQCWARSLYVKIVEPYVENSHLVVPLPLNNNQQLLRFRDIFDPEVWKLSSAQLKFAPLVPLEEFYEKAPRELIVVRFKYLTFRMMKRRETVMDGRDKEDCEATAELSAKIDYLRTAHNFSVIREVCIDFANGNELTLQQFNHRIYTNIDPKSVTVLIEEWRGLSPQDNGKRVVLPSACAAVHVKSMTYTWPSQRLVCDSKRYKQKFYFGEDYISVMVRTEKVGRLGSSPEFMSKCLNKTLKEWRALRTTTGLKKTFLAMDIGRYGSYSLVEKNSGKYHALLHLYTDFIKELLGKEATIQSWEASFESIAPGQDSGYIGSLQKTIAAQGKCMVLTGGGSFQRHSKVIHERTAPSKKHCVQIVQECSRGLE